MSETALTERVRIFDRQGFPLVEFQPLVSRSWAIGKEGRASFEYPVRKTNIVNKETLKIGNYLLIESSRLPTWIGVIDLPREWDSKNVVVNAYGIERLFSYRRGGLETKLTGSAGNIFKQMINYINQQEKTIMEVGDVWEGGQSRQETLNPNKMDVNLRQLQERSLEEYNFTTQIKRGRLTIQANWVNKLGVETPLTLLEGKKGGNIEAPRYKEDGEVINDVLGFGDGITWTSRPNVTTIDTNSISEYGLRQDGKEYRGVTIPATIYNNNVDYLRTTVKPRGIFEITALNISNTFDYLSIGNYVNVKLQNLGFLDGGLGVLARTRILGMSYNPRQGQKVKLVLEEV